MEDETMVAAVESDDVDPRHKWLIERISNILGIYDTKYASEMINEHLDLIQGFFDDDIASHDDVRKQIMFVWRTFYDKMVEETITVLEEVPPPTPPPKTTKKQRKDRGNCTILCRAHSELYHHFENR